MPSRRNADGLFMMANSDSDDSLVEDNDEDFEEHPRSGPKTRGKGRLSKKTKDKGKGKEPSYSWEAAYQRSWDDVQEDESGNLQGAIHDFLMRGRRKRLLEPSNAIRRSIIRHLVLALDLSSSMLDRDMRPSRFDLSLEYTREFIAEWFDQNPLGQMAIVAMRSGVSERIANMSGNPQELLNAISDKRKLDPDGEPSLQNVINMARGSMSHLPTHSSREVVVIFGSLTTIDPGNIHETLEACIADKITVSFIALAAEMKICREFCEKTGGKFGVAMNEGHFKDLLFELVPPPAQRAQISARAGSGTSNLSADLMMMGFPTRLPDTSPPSLCACHSQLTSGGYLCPRCLSKLCDVPTDCDICGLMIVSSPHLARSYHHLFPVKPYQAISIDEAAVNLAGEPVCHACAIAFKGNLPKSGVSTVIEGISPLGRYQCPDCKHHFCADCDVFVHEVVHVCPSCHDQPSDKQ